MSNKANEVLLDTGKRYFAYHVRGKGWNVLDAVTNDPVFTQRIFSRIGAESYAKSLNDKVRKKNHEQ